MNVNIIKSYGSTYEVNFKPEGGNYWKNATANRFGLVLTTDYISTRERAQLCEFIRNYEKTHRPIY